VGVEVLSPRLLSFQKGHVLTEEDIALLNQYLASADHEMLVSSDDAINTSVKTSAKIDNSGKQGTFNATTPEMVGAKEYHGEEFQLKKSRLPFARSLKIALNSFKSKPFRLVITMILTIISLTMFGVSATLAGYAPEKAFVSCYQYFEVQSVSLTRQKTTFKGDYYSSENVPFSYKERADISSETGLEFQIYPTVQQALGYFADRTISMDQYFTLEGGFSSSGTSSTQVTPLYASVYSDSRCAFLQSADEVSLKNIYGASLIAGHFPASGTECLITDYRYEAMKRYGYAYYTAAGDEVQLDPSACSSETALLSASPLISFVGNPDGTTKKRPAKTLTIVGIVSTGVDLTPYAALDNTVDSGDNWRLQVNLSLLCETSAVNAIIGGPNLYQTMGGWTGFTWTESASIYTFLSAGMKLDDATLKNWYAYLAKNNAFTYSSDDTGTIRASVNDVVNPDKVVKGRAYLGSATSSFAWINSFVSNFKTTFFWIGFATACFAVLLLATFIASSISYQRRKIGILRAIGARGMDIYGIFLNESMLITLMSAFVGVILTAVIDGVLSNEVNKSLGFVMPLFQFSFWIFLLVVALAAFTAALSSFVPCLAISKKKPIDSINER
jgi:cell division protein FtsX